MAEKIIIENGIARIIEESILAECKADDMLQSFLAKLPVKTKFIPRNCVFYERKENMRAVYVIENCPRTIRIKWTGNRQESDEPEGAKSYRIALPFIYIAFGVNEAGGMVACAIPFASKTPIRVEKETVYVAPMSNVYGGGHQNICLGNDMKIDNSWPMSQKIETINERIFSANWNSDLGFELPAAIRTFRKWDAETAKDPLVWMKPKYAEHNLRTFAGVCEYALAFAPR